MKTSFLKYIAVFLLSVWMVNSQAQDKPTGKATVTDNVAATRQFSFTPQFANPLVGSQIALNYSAYVFSISGDSINCYLPYYGRAFVAPINSSDGPLTFSSTDFTYNVTKSNGKKQEITIETKDRMYNNKFFFTIYSNGTAQLQVTSPDRQPINYEGQVTGSQAMK